MALVETNKPYHNNWIYIEHCYCDAPDDREFSHKGNCNICNSHMSKCALYSFTWDSIRWMKNYDIETYACEKCYESNKNIFEDSTLRHKFSLLEIIKPKEGEHKSKFKGGCDFCGKGFPKHGLIVFHWNLQWIDGQTNNIKLENPLDTVACNKCYVIIRWNEFERYCVVEILRKDFYLPRDIWNIIIGLLRIEYN